MIEKANRCVKKALEGLSHGQAKSIGGGAIDRRGGGQAGEEDIRKSMTG